MQGYGLSREDSHPSANPANASLIKRFNQHSTMVLRACDKRISPSAAGHENGHSSNGTTNNTQTNGPSTSRSAHAADAKDQPPVSKKVGSSSLLRVLPGLNMVSEIHRPVLQAAYLLNPVSEAEATYDYELIMTFFLLSTILF